MNDGLKMYVDVVEAKDELCKHQLALFLVSSKRALVLSELILKRCCHQHFCFASFGQVLRYMHDFDSTHCTPLPGVHFLKPWNAT